MPRDFAHVGRAGSRGRVGERGTVLAASASPLAQTFVSGSGVDGMRSVETPRAG